MTDDLDRTGYFPEGGDPTNEWISDRVVGMLRTLDERMATLAAGIRDVRRAVCGGE